MALVADFHVIQIPQVRILADDVTFEFNSDIDDAGHAIFQLMYRGLTTVRAEVTVNQRPAVALNPYGFADESAWFQTTFITPPGVVQRNNQITFVGLSGVSDLNGYWISNVFVMTKQDA